MICQPTLARNIIMPSPANTTAQMPGRTVRTLSEREEFLIFIKILFLLLPVERNDMLRVRARQIISKCTRRNRLGHQEYANLPYALGRRLRHVVGEECWTNARDYLDNYCKRRDVHRSPGSVV